MYSVASTSVSDLITERDANMVGPEEHFRRNTFAVDQAKYSVQKMLEIKFEGVLEAARV